MTTTLYAPPMHLAPTRIVPKDRSELDRWAMRFARTPPDYASCASVLCDLEATDEQPTHRQADARR